MPSNKNEELEFLIKISKEINKHSFYGCQPHIAIYEKWNIDEDGYLRRTLEELVDDLAFREGLQVTDEKMHEIVEQVKQFDPIGVGAYDLQEAFLAIMQKIY